MKHLIFGMRFHYSYCVYLNIHIFNLMFLISALLPLLTKFLHSKQNDYSLNMHLINCPFQELADVYCFVYGPECLSSICEAGFCLSLV